MGFKPHADTGNVIYHVRIETGFLYQASVSTDVAVYLTLSAAEFILWLNISEQV